MANYFDATAESDDLLLLPEHLRKAQEIENIAPVAESDVIGLYTRRASRFSTLSFPALAEVVNQDLSLVVFLLGYKVDADDPAVDVDLKLALKRTISDVVEWRIRRRRKDPAIASESTDIGKTVTWNAHNRADMPPNTGWRLQNFDLREPAWSL